MAPVPSYSLETSRGVDSGGFAREAVPWYRRIRGEAVIREIDESLERWVAGVVGDDVKVSFGAPAERVEHRSIGLYLLELAELPAPSGSAPSPLGIELRYLVTVHAPDPKIEHGLLESLVFAAMERPDTRVDLRPLSAAEWSALHVPPRPSFSIRLPLRRERKQAQNVAKRVLHPLTLKASALVAVAGRVLGPGDTPIPDAEIELEATEARVTTDASGRFYFAAAPAAPELELIVRVKGLTKRVRAPSGQPLVIRLESLED